MIIPARTNIPTKIMSAVVILISLVTETSRKKPGNAMSRQCPSIDLEPPFVFLLLLEHPNESSQLDCHSANATSSRPSRSKPAKFRGEHYFIYSSLLGDGRLVKDSSTK
jgi:hypothetical protein